MTDQHFLITGAYGCIGAWVVRQLVREGIPVTLFDIAETPYRLRFLLSDEEIAQTEFFQGDITDFDTVQRAFQQSNASHIVHLAGLQVPFCKAEPTTGARVNVVGTVNVLQAVRQAGGHVQGISYASSVAALGPDGYYPQKPVGDDVRLRPDTLYGIYKQANEHTARVYWQDWGVGSVGLRPYIVFGVGRDQGLTSDLAKAILAAAAKRPFRIKFSGPVALQYTADTASIFIEAARSGHQGAAVCNLRQDVIDVADFVAALITVAPDADITAVENNPLPFPADLDDHGLRQTIGDIPHTPLLQAIQAAFDHFSRLLAARKIDLSQLE